MGMLNPVRIKALYKISTLAVRIKILPIKETSLCHNGAYYINFPTSRQGKKTDELGSKMAI